MVAPAPESTQPEAATPAAKLSSSIAQRIQQLDWEALDMALSNQGYARTECVLTPAECRELINLYGDGARFRSHIDMARYRFGLGDYKYFADRCPGQFSNCETPFIHRWLQSPTAGWKI